MLWYFVFSIQEGLSSALMYVYCVDFDQVCWQQLVQVYFCVLTPSYEATFPFKSGKLITHIFSKLIYPFYSCCFFLVSKKPLYFTIGALSI